MLKLTDIAKSLVMLGLLQFAATGVQADNAREGEWLQALKNAHMDNGSSLPLYDLEERDALSFDSGQLKRLFGDRASLASHSNFQVSPLNYQASVSDDEVKVHFYCRF